VFRRLDSGELRLDKSDETFCKIAAHPPEPKHAAATQSARETIVLDKSEHDLENFNN
jgi:hypothetical protein